MLSREGVRWIGTPAAAVGAADAVAWVLRWDDPRVDGWLARSPPDPAELARFAGRADAGRRIVRRRLARLLLAEIAGCSPGVVRLTGASLGPVVVAAPAGWYLSLAGTGVWCAIAVGREPLGMDVEAIVGDPLPPDLLTVGERAWLAALPVGERLAASLACWTGKEAHSKRLGRPRDDDPVGIDVWIDGPLGEATSAACRSRLAVRRAGGWIAAVALPG